MICNRLVKSFNIVSVQFQNSSYLTTMPFFINDVDAEEYGVIFIEEAFEYNIVRLDSIPSHLVANKSRSGHIFVRMDDGSFGLRYGRFLGSGKSYGDMENIGIEELVRYIFEYNDRALEEEANRVAARQLAERYAHERLLNPRRSG